MRPGDVFAGKYRVERLLGRGGMGLVVAAKHLHLGERVAIKLLLPGSPVTRGAFARFLREGQAAARMRSEHVARVHDAGVLETGEPYLVLEYLEGVDLRDLVRRRGPLPIDTAIAFVLQVCEALAEAHSLGVVHRDLKPANLFLTHRADGSSIVKVIDFGISKITSVEPGDEEEGASLTAHGAAIGTPSYMAPEQMRSARAVDGRADIWSIGAVLHGLLTGSPPFAGETMIEVYDNILRGPPSLRSAREEASPELEAIVSRCLQKDPAERYQNVGQLAAALGDLVPPESRLSAERAIRISEGAEPARVLIGGAAPDSADLGMMMATTAAGDLSGERTAAGARPSDHPATDPSLDPSWAGEKCTSGISRSPADRPSAAEIPTGPVPGTTRPERQPPSISRSRRRSRAMTGAVVLLAALAGAAVWRGPGGPLPEGLLPALSTSPRPPAPQPITPSLPVLQPVSGTTPAQLATPGVSAEPRPSAVAVATSVPPASSTPVLPAGLRGSSRYGVRPREAAAGSVPAPAAPPGIGTAAPAAPPSGARKVQDLVDTPD